ncbi:PREDICTED: transmembrane channel-like protein 4 [Myotis brandtii]|nr:PREDICTED: transmembrane channel-like protein 4 [Myotis brandtii]
MGVGRPACSKREVLGDQILVGGGGWRPGFPKEGPYGWNLFLEEEGPGGPDSYVLKGEELRTMSPEEWTYLVVLLISIPIGFLFKKAGPGLKRWGAAAVGLGLTLFTCGPHTLHSLITILGTWALIQAQPCSCHALALAWTFSYLLFFRALSLLGLPTPTPFTNAVQLLLTLKVSPWGKRYLEYCMPERPEAELRPGLKRWGAAAVGLGLTLFTCGPHTLHSLITILGTWALIQAQPCSCHALALAWTFSYLLFFRALSLLGLPTPTPFTNAVQLLLTLKVRLPSTLPAGPTLSSVLNELPSAATLRYRGPGVLPWGALEEDEDEERNIQAFAEAAEKELQDPGPSRELPWPMQARRAHRQRHARDQMAQGSGSRVANWALRLRRSKEKMREGLHTLEPWGWTLKRIGGQFGAGTESYFLLLRFLLFLNVLASVLKVCMTLLGRAWGGLLVLGVASGGGARRSKLSPGARQGGGWRVGFGAQTSGCGRKRPGNPLQRGGSSGTPASPRGPLPSQKLPLVSRTRLLQLGVDYLPSIFISGVNLVLPPVFKLITPQEGPGTRPWLTPLLSPARTVFLRLASLLVLLSSLWNQITCGGNAEAEKCKACGYNYKELPCWETRLGQEMYKLLIFDLLTGLATMLLIQFPQKLLCGLCPGPLGRLGTQEFQVPDEVLGLIYAQTVVWVGSFFCPLLPLLNTAKFLLLFYLKKLTLFSTCSPASRTFRASTANFFFPMVLLLGLAISAIPVLYSIFLIPPSKLCGPFRGQLFIWDQIPESISRLPQITQDFLFFLGTQAFAVPLLLISSILMAYTLALANSYGGLISELKRQVEKEARNKVFLAQRAVALSSDHGAL